MQIILLFMGMFMEPLTIMMVTIPIFMPIVKTFGFDLLWFGTVMLLNMEMAATSPPFGTVLFVMKGVAPPDTTMGDIYRAALPFLLCDLIAITLIIVFPQLVLWLPGLMK
jgi:TRAP-type C4-dicarboxylate transport system permease large subunit